MVNLFVTVIKVVAFVVSLSSGRATVSFTATGNWAESTKADCSHYMCSPDGRLSWHPSYSSVLYDNVTGCDMLLNKGITTIFFHGDSYLRQVYAAMLITLNGDYKYGSQANSQNSPHCSYHAQFNEKHCGTYQLNHHGLICGGKILLDPLLNEFSNIEHCRNKPGSVVLWSFGNHQLSRFNGRAGVNNATLYSQHYQRNICPQLRRFQAKTLEKGQPSTGTSTYNVQSSNIANVHSNGQPIGNTPCSVWWLSTHYRVREIFPDESPRHVENFNVEMRDFFDRGECGETNYIDVYNMTSRITLDHLTEAISMTYDRVHWGMAVNLVKAQIILNALATTTNVQSP